MRAAALVLAATLAGCAATPEQVAADRQDAARDLARATEGLVAGKPQTCIGSTDADGPQVIAPDTLVYRAAGRTWVTQAVGCPLGRDPLIVVNMFGSQLCRNDTFRTFQRGSVAVPGPICRFGDFTPYAKPPKAS